MIYSICKSCKVISIFDTSIDRCKWCGLQFLEIKELQPTEAQIKMIKSGKYRVIKQ